MLESLFEMYLYITRCSGKTGIEITYLIKLLQPVLHLLYYLIKLLYVLTLRHVCHHIQNHFTL